MDKSLLIDNIKSYQKQNKSAYGEFVKRYAYCDAKIEVNLNESKSNMTFIKESKKNIINKQLKKQSSKVASFIIKNLNSLHDEDEDASNFKQTSNNEVEGLSVNQSNDLLILRDNEQQSQPEQNQEDDKTDKRILWKRNNVNDSEEESSCDENESKLILSKRNSFRRMWNTLITLALAYLSIFHVYRVAFDKDIGTFFRNLILIIDFVFIVDIPLRFFYTFRNTDHFEVKSLPKILDNYIYGSLIFDIFALTPFFMSFVLTSEYLGLLEILRLLKIGRLIKWFRVFKFFKVAQTKIDYKNSSDKKSHLVFGFY